MNKPNRIIASFIFCLALASGAFVATVINEAANKSLVSTSLGMSKDTAGMDSLVDSLQGRGMVKAALSSTPLRSRVEDKAVFSSSSTKVAMDSSEEATEVDVRMLIAGLVLVGVIALRRMS